MRPSIVLFASLVAACAGDGGVPDAPPQHPIDLPPDPFEGRYESAAELPAIDCVAGALAGFAGEGYWPALAMTIEPALDPAGTAPVLAIAFDGGVADVPARVELTADTLFARATYFDGEAWHLRAVAACAVDPDGTLHGSELRCRGTAACEPGAFTASPLTRLPGEAEGDHLALLGELPGAGPVHAVRVARTTAFVAQGPGGVRVVSLVNPRGPVELTRITSMSVVGLDFVRGIDGHRYLVAAGAPHTQVFDVEDPARPVLVSDLVFPATGISVDGTTVTLIDERRAHAFDLSQPATPRRIASYEPAGARWTGVFAANGLLYLTDAATGLHVVDVRDPAAPRELAAEPAARPARAPMLAAFESSPRIAVGAGPAIDVLHGDRASPSYLARLGSWQQRALVDVQATRALGSRLFVAHARDGVRVIDLANPHAPARLAYFNTWREGTGGASPRAGALALDVDPAVNRVYVADSVRGLVVLQGDATVFP